MEVIEKALLGSESIVQGGGLIESTVVLLSKFLRPQFFYKPSKIDFSQYIPQSSHGLRSKYELLGYVIMEWLHHTSSLGVESQDESSPQKFHLTAILRQFQKLVFQKQMLFNFRPWEEIKATDPKLPHLPLICWAVRNRHVALLRAMSDSVSIPLNADLHDLSHGVVGTRALMQAIYRGHKDIVTHLIFQGVSQKNCLPWRLFDVDQEDFNNEDLSIPRKVEMGCFGLHLAVARNNAEMVKLLLDSNADPELGIDVLETEMNIEGRWISPLAHASAIGSLQIVRVLLEYGASIEGQCVSSATWEGLRFRYGNPGVITSPIIASGHAVSPAQFRYFQLRSFVTEESLRLRYTTPLIHAVRSGHLSMMEYLMNAGADLDNFDYEMNTPLSTAAADGFTEAARLLIQRGAKLSYNPRMEKIPAVSPVIEAVKYGEVEVLEILLEAGADLNTSIQSQTAVMIAVANKNIQALELLLKYGADFNVEKEIWNVQSWKSIPLCMAIKGNDRQMVELLLDYGANPLWSADWAATAVTPLQVAREHANLVSSEIVLEFHKQQLEIPTGGPTYESSNLRNSQGSHSDQRSDTHRNSTDMTFDHGSELDSESDIESAVMALARGIELDSNLDSSTESVIVTGLHVPQQE